MSDGISKIVKSSPDVTLTPANSRLPSYINLSLLLFYSAERLTILQTFTSFSSIFKIITKNQAA